MTGTIKKCALSLLMALAVLVSAWAVFEKTSVEAQAACGCPRLGRAITNAEIEATIEWAKTWIGQNGWQSKPIGCYVESKDNCVAFVANAFYEGGGITPWTNKNEATHYLNSVNGHKIYHGDPPRGAIALFTGVNRNTSHVAISVGNGKVIEAGSQRIQYWNLADYTNYKYEGYMWYGDMQPPASGPDVAPKISAPKTQDEVKARLDNILKGEYGDGKTFPYSNKPVPAKLAGTEGETATLGYARYAFFQMFGKPLSTGVKSNVYELANSNGNLKVIASCSGTSTAEQMKADVLNTKPGDIIQGKGNGFYQTMIVYSHDENSITILDCDNDYKCGIQLRTRDWARFSGSFKQYTIYRAANYPEPKLTPDTSPTDKKQKGDINGDGKTNMADVATLLTAAIMGKTSDLQKYDFNGDGKVNMSDVSALLTYVVSL